MTYVNRLCELCGRELAQSYSHAVCPVCKQTYEELKAAQHLKSETGTDSSDDSSELQQSTCIAEQDAVRSDAHLANPTRRTSPAITVLAVIVSLLVLAFIVVLAVGTFGSDGILAASAREKAAREAAQQKAALVQETRKMRKITAVPAPTYAIGDRLRLTADAGPSMAYDNGDPYVAVATSVSAFYDMMIFMYADDNVGLQQMLLNWRMQVVSPGREAVVLGAYEFFIPSIPDDPDPFVYEVRIGGSSTTHWVHHQSLVPPTN